jgi:hypothetical protein
MQCANTDRPLTNQRKDRFMAKANLTAQRLRELVHYSPESGEITRLVGPNKGQIKRKPNRSGHMVASIGGHECLVHRLIWLYMTGDWPDGMLDHINGIPSDNRWCNLRQSDAVLNQQNRRRANKNSTSGLLGASWSKEKQKWVARLYSRGKYMHLGYFRTPQEAHAAYIEAKRVHHAGCTL